MSTATAPPRSPFAVNPVEFVLAIIGFIALALAAPFVWLLEGPMAGWHVGALLFTLMWALQRLVSKVIVGMDPTHAVGLSGITSIGRAMVTVMILFVIALKVDETVGLVAGGVFAAAFTFDLMGRTIIFAIREKERKAARKEIDA